MVTNVGIDASLGFLLEGGFVAFRTSEARSGNTDLNGDGDATDFVLHIYDTQSGVLRNTGLEASGGLNVNGTLLAWAVSESRQGMTDLNGDGDTNDYVVHLADMASGTTKNLRFASASYAVDGNTLAFQVLESFHGMTDLNRDGDTMDAPLHLYDISTGTITNVGIDAGGGFEISGNRVAFGVHESRQGSSDLNGDGDATDVVMHLYDMTSRSSTNLRLATSSHGFHFDGDLLAFTVRESHNASADLNGDGDVNDLVLHVYEPSSNTLSSLGLAVSDRNDFQVDGGMIAFAVSEIAQGVDVNGDVDAFDEVIHLYDGTITNLGYAIEGFQLDAGHLAFGVREFRQFVVDLNGDGDTADLVVHLHDAASGTTVNLMTDATLGFKLDGDMLLAFGAREANQGGNDGNGDGDASDYTLYVFDISSGDLISLEADPSGGLQQFQLAGPFVSFGVREFAQGMNDLNGDRDFNDIVLHYFDVGTGLTTNLGHDVTLGHQLQDAKIAYAVTEARQGMTDLNGDGDALDVVLHVADLNPRAMSAAENDDDDDDVDDDNDDEDDDDDDDDDDNDDDNDDDDDDEDDDDDDNDDDDDR